MAAPGVIGVLTGAAAARDKLGGIPPNFMPEEDHIDMPATPAQIWERVREARK